MLNCSSEYLQWFRMENDFAFCYERTLKVVLSGRARSERGMSDKVQLFCKFSFFMWSENMQSLNAVFAQQWAEGAREVEGENSFNLSRFKSLPFRFCWIFSLEPLILFLRTSSLLLNVIKTLKLIERMRIPLRSTRRLCLRRWSIPSCRQGFRISSHRGTDIRAQRTLRTIRRERARLQQKCTASRSDESLHDRRKRWIDQFPQFRYSRFDKWRRPAAVHCRWH